MPTKPRGGGAAAAAGEGEGAGGAGGAGPSSSGAGSSAARPWSAGSLTYQQQQQQQAGVRGLKGILKSSSSSSHGDGSGSGPGVKVLIYTQFWVHRKLIEQELFLHGVSVLSPAQLASTCGCQQSGKCGLIAASCIVWLAGSSHAYVVSVCLLRSHWVPGHSVCPSPVCCTNTPPLHPQHATSVQIPRLLTTPPLLNHLFTPRHFLVTHPSPLLLPGTLCVLPEGHAKARPKCCPEHLPQ